jgi:hypothetical protein
MSDPERLLGPTGSAFERSLLRTAEAPEPTREQAEVLWSALEKRLALGATAAVGGGTAQALAGQAAAHSAAYSAGRAAAAKTMSGMVLKVASSLALAGTVTVVGASSWLHGATPPAPAVTSVASPLVGPSKIAIVPAATPTVAAAPPPAMSTAALPFPPPRHTVAAPSSAAASVSVVALPVAPAAAVAPVRSLRTESRVLLSARRTLRAGDCAAAVAQLDAERASLASGTLSQEYEALAIEAMACSGQQDEAARRSAAFVTAHPESPYAETIRRFARP